ncbi:uncharacterized protein F5891DRAFT_350925 [Suillus fuscotomentosus]|uniref:Peroxisomal membrane protein PEX14 n=1 Tax=Suillus fuscotomentosus TaxID=1912939 RepID=A0AAD4HS34_9AGAM|nr:uncharacterized protein F5891DRAFT_350925 [Suillus fuscotomentosus]KAG1906958.1 hypothetical protein F5891DRAFT_350925 [Suillus fuscotomentosus]
MEPDQKAEASTQASSSDADKQLAQPVPETKPDQTPQPSVDRSELIARARTFLSTPHIRSQDDTSKHAFLVEKGLTQDEIYSLLREIPPPVPPRTYPQPPPSNLPNMLVGIAHMLTWLAGSSAFVLFIYYRFLLPRISQTYHARRALRAHQSGLLLRLNESLATFKEKQAECFVNLPTPIIYKEEPECADCHSLDDILACRRKADIDDEDASDTSNVSILRSAIEELTHSKESTEGISTGDLFDHLEAKLPWLKGERGAACQNDLWQTLNKSPLFTSTSPQSSSSSSIPEHPSHLLWSYVPPPISLPPPMIVALDTLQAALPRKAAAPPLSRTETVPLRPAQRTLQTLADFTGYIATQTYAFGTHMRGISSSLTTNNTDVDEIRREIRALKGLVLNRRSFLPGIGIPRTSSEPSKLALAGV